MIWADTFTAVRRRVNIRERVPFVSPYIDLASGFVGPQAPTIAKYRAEAKALPDVTLVLSKTAGGRAIRQHLHTRVLGIRVQQNVCVLALPEIASDYLKGKHKQALRTNITKANKMGVSSARVERDAVHLNVEKILAKGEKLRHSDFLLSDPFNNGIENWVASDPAGEPIAIARVQVDLDVAWLKYMVATDSARDSGARYKLSADIFMSLAERGVKHIIVESILKLDSGLVYFQDRLGFLPMRATIVVVGASRPDVERLEKRVSIFKSKPKSGRISTNASLRRRPAPHNQKKGERCNASMFVPPTYRLQQL